jgi:hypothetical protein
MRDCVASSPSMPVPPPRPVHCAPSRSREPRSPFTPPLTATVSRAAVYSLRAHPSTFSAFPYYARSRICASSRRTGTELSSLLLDNSEKRTSMSMARRARWKVQACRTVLDHRPGCCAATGCRRSDWSFKLKAGLHPSLASLLIPQSFTLAI